MPTDHQTAPAADPARPASDAGGLVRTIVYALLIALVIRIALFQPFTIP